jgi:hypothetical protein
VISDIVYVNGVSSGNRRHIHAQGDVSTGTVPLRHFSREIRRCDKKDRKFTETISCRTSLGDNQG